MRHWEIDDVSVVNVARSEQRRECGEGRDYVVYICYRKLDISRPVPGGHMDN